MWSCLRRADHIRPLQRRVIWLATVERMTPPLRLASVRAVSLLGVLLCVVASAQASAPSSLRSQLGLPATAPAAQAFKLRSTPPRALTPVSPTPGGWTLPSAGASIEPPKTGPIVNVLGTQAARLGLTEVSMQDVQISRDVRWTRVGLRLRNLGASPALLDSLRLWASGEQGSDLATLPGLYDQGGAPVLLLAAGETRELSVWIRLPVEGSGDTGLRGGEHASALLVSLGTRTLRFALPRVR